MGSSTISTSGAPDPPLDTQANVVKPFLGDTIEVEIDDDEAGFELRAAGEEPALRIEAERRAIEDEFVLPPTALT